MADVLTLNLRKQTRVVDAEGRNVWRVDETAKRVSAEKVAILVCDMWDDHASKAAAKRTAEMAPRMNRALVAARKKGAFIIHGPNDCMDFYAAHPARKRMEEMPNVLPPKPVEIDETPMPFEGKAVGSDSPSIDLKHDRVPWTRQHPAIEIDEARDGISVSGAEIFGAIWQRGIEQYVIMGVHTNCCILHRTFGVKQMVRWGVPTALARDLTDAMYDPHQPPYVTHDEGTLLVVEYIEKFWCPTIDSANLAR